MIKNIQSFNTVLFFGLLLTILGCTMMGGCEYIPESTFKLADESRLPKWTTLPPGLTRADVSITMSYYINPWPWGSDVKITLQDAKSKIRINAYGRENGGGLLKLKHPPLGSPAGYPAYEIITVNGITDIVEHRKMEPIFYVTDDPIVWKDLIGVQP